MNRLSIIGVFFSRSDSGRTEVGGVACTLFAKIMTGKAISIKFAGSSFAFAIAAARKIAGKKLCLFKITSLLGLRMLL